MNKAEKIVCDFVTDFVEKNWDKIDTKKFQIESKEEFIQKTKTDPQDATWFLREVMPSYTNRAFKEDLIVYHQIDKQPYFDVLNINGVYIKLQLQRTPFVYLLSIAEPKQKLVTYFD